MMLAVLMTASAAKASDFNYDDDVEIGVTDGDWENPGPETDIEFSDDPGGVETIGGTSAEDRWEISLYGCGFNLMVKDGAVIVEASDDCTIPVYRLETSTHRMIRLRKGVNTFTPEDGTYIMLGRKFH